MALVGNISGSSLTNSVIGVSGSVIFANRPDADFPQLPGNDVFFFVSGSISGSGSEDKKALFGGDVVTSGSIITKSGISGSLTRLADGTSYLIASGAATITSNSNGSVTIYAPPSTSPGGSSGEVQFNNLGTFSGSSLFTFNPTVGAVTASYFVGNGAGLTQLTASQVYVSGAVAINGYLQLFPVGNVVIPSNQAAGYMYVSGNTNDIYFTQYQPGSGFNNTTRLRWLEGMLTTGLLHGGVLSTQNGTTTFSITSGSGIIMSYNASTGSDPYPTVNFVSWPTYVSQSLTYVTSSLITYIGINPSGGIIQQTSPFTLTADADYITLGRILHQSGSVTNGSSTQPIVSYGTNHWQDDFTRAFGPLKVSGHILAGSSSAGVGTLGLIKTGGESYVIGKNYTVDPNNPNIVSSANDANVTVSKIYRAYVSGSTVKLDTGVANAGYTFIDPANWNDNGTLNSVGGGQFSIQRVYWYPNTVSKAFTVYYGQNTYSSLDVAQQSLASETFTEGENTAGSAILVGYIIVKGNATDLTNTSQARILQAGISRGAGAGGGGGVAFGSTVPGGLDTYVQFNDGGSTFGGDSGLTYNKTTDTLTIGNVSIGDTGLVSTTGTTVSLFNSTATTVNFAGAATSIKMGTATGTNVISGSIVAPNGISGSHTKLADGTSFIIAGNNLSVTTGSTGAITIDNVTSSYFDSVVAGAIYTTGSVAFRGGEGITTPSSKGSDVFFYVSGSISGSNATDKKAVFGGDVIISGSLKVGTGSITITSNDVQFGGASTRIEKSSTDLKFYDASNPSGVTLSSLATGAGVPSYWTSTSNGLVNTTGSVSIQGDLTVNGTTVTVNTTNLEVKDAVIGLGFSSGTIAQTAGDRGFIAGLSGGDNATFLWKNASSEFIVGRTASSSTGSLPITLTSYANFRAANVQANIVTASLGFSGSHTKLADGTSFIIAGNNLSVTSASNGAITIGTTIPQGGIVTASYFDSTTNGAIFTTGSAAFRGSENITSPSSKGTDVFFYVSGSLAGTNKSLFGGFVTVSGTMSASIGQFSQLTSSFFKVTDSFESSANQLEITGTFIVTGSARMTGSLSINGSLSQGLGVVSSGLNSHAQGLNTTASGQYSHAEGSGSVASAIYSHAEGVLTNATSQGSHAEGFTTNVNSSIYSHTEGSNTLINLSYYSHAEGRNTTVYLNDYSHAEGEYTYAYAQGSHAEGYGTLTRGTNSHVEGYLTTSSVGASYSHAEGEGSITVGRSSHAEGLYTIASGSYQYVGGKYNKRGNNFSLFVVGDGTGDADANRSDIIRVNSGSVGGQGSLQLTGSLYVNGTSMFDSSGRAPGTIGSDVFFYVSGSASGTGVNDKKSVFGGDVRVSGSLNTNILTASNANITTLVNTTATSSYFTVTNEFVLATNVMEVTGTLIVTGSTQITGTISVSGSYLLNVVSGTSAPTYNVGLFEQLVVFTANNVTGVLPAAAPVGAQIIFKEGTGLASTSGGQMLSSSAGRIDGSATFTMPSINYTSVAAVKIKASPEQWIII